MTTEVLQDNTVAELRAIADELEIPGIRRMRKDDLIAAIQEAQPPSIEAAEEAAEEAAVAPLEAQPINTTPEISSTVVEHVELVRDAVRSGWKRVDVPYINDDIAAQVEELLTPAEMKIVVFGGTGRGIIG